MNGKIQQQVLFRDLSLTERRWAVDPVNPECPFNRFIGNEKVIKRLGRAAFKALGRTNRACNDFAFALFGPASTGKTTLATLFAEVLQLPLCIIQPQSVRRVQDVFLAVKKVLAHPWIIEKDGSRAELSLVEVDYPKNYIFPPMVVFIDEVHNLNRKVVQGLLKATERNDAQLVTEEGITVDCGYVCWLIATTDRGGLFDAFDTRFEKLNLRLYNKAEMAKIINLVNKDWDHEICEIVARYCSFVPREALTFAKDMRIEAEMSESSDWAQVAATVANDHGIDPFGMTFQRVSVLKALGRQPVSAVQLPHFVTPRVKEEELRNFVMPPLQAVTSDQKTPLVIVSSRGYCITPAGLAELDKRDIGNAGEEAIPENIRQMYDDCDAA